MKNQELFTIQNADIALCSRKLARKYKYLKALSDGPFSSFHYASRYLSHFKVTYAEQTHGLRFESHRHNSIVGPMDI